MAAREEPSPAKRMSGPPAADEARLDRMVEPEYASVSGTAVLALILAGISVVAFLPVPADLPLPGTWLRLPILMILPLATIPVALGAMRSIRRSEGTKTGMPLAQGALALSLLVTAGAGLLHGMHQGRQYALHQALVAKADGYLKNALANRPETIFGALVANGVVGDDQRDGFMKAWRQMQYTMNEGGGAYYGRQLEKAGAYREDDPEEEIVVDIGVVIWRLQFEKGAMDVRFLFRLIEGQWKLINFSHGYAYEFPPEGAQPKPRFEP